MKLKESILYFNLSIGIAIGLMLISLFFEESTQKILFTYVAPPFVLIAIVIQLFCIRCPKCNISFRHSNFYSMKFCPSCGKKINGES